MLCYHVLILIRQKSQKVHEMTESRLIYSNVTERSYPLSTVHGCLATTPNAKGTSYISWRNTCLCRLLLIIVIINKSYFLKHSVFYHSLCWPLRVVPQDPLPRDKIAITRSFSWLIADQPENVIIPKKWNKVLHYQWKQYYVIS